MKEEYKNKMIYCHNKECEYCDDVVGWCILSTWEEFESTCPIKNKIIQNFEDYIIKDNDEKKMYESLKESERELKLALNQKLDLVKENIALKNRICDLEMKLLEIKNGMRK